MPGSWRSDAWQLSLQSGADLVHDVSGEVCVAEGDDAVLDQTPTLVEVLAGADLLLQACGQECQQQGPNLQAWHEYEVLPVLNGVV